MGLGLLLVSALGGYWFLTHFNFTRYLAVRSSGYHIFFQSGVVGIVLFAVSYLGILGLEELAPRTESAWASPSPDTFTDAVIVSVLLGLLLPHLFNLFYDERRGALRAARSSGNSIELSIAESLDPPKLIEITLKSGKSYVGFPTGSPLATVGEADVSLIPTASGYRDKDTQELLLTTNYEQVIRSSLSEAPQAAQAEYQIVIAISEVVSVRRFDPEVYSLFQKARVAEK